MIRNILTAALAGAAITVAVPAIAQDAKVKADVNANVQVPPAGANARVNSQGSVNASPQAQVRANEKSAVKVQTTPNAGVKANVNSQGLGNASVNGIAHANGNSVLARGAVAADALPGLNTGLTVNNSAGTSVGTVSKVVTGADGAIRAVVVTNAQGQTYTVPANSLSISGGVVTTTSTSIGG